MAYLRMRKVLRLIHGDPVINQHPHPPSLMLRHSNQSALNDFVATAHSGHMTLFMATTERTRVSRTTTLPFVRVMLPPRRFHLARHHNRLVHSFIPTSVQATQMEPSGRNHSSHHHQQQQGSGFEPQNFTNQRWERRRAPRPHGSNPRTGSTNTLRSRPRRNNDLQQRQQSGSHYPGGLEIIDQSSPGQGSRGLSGVEEVAVEQRQIETASQPSARGSVDENGDGVDLGDVQGQNINTSGSDQTQDTLNAEPVVDNFNPLTLWDSDYGPFSGATRPDLIERVTVCFQYSTTELSSQPNGENEESQLCPICLCELESGVYVRRLPCMHVFHRDCIDRWLSRNRSCAMCRADISHQQT